MVIFYRLDNYLSVHVEFIITLVKSVRLVESQQWKKLEYYISALYS